MAIELFTNPLVISMVFVVSLVLFHGFLLFQRISSNEIFWKSVDYIWLSMSILALIGLVVGTSDIITSINNVIQQKEFDKANNHLVRKLDYYYQSSCIDVKPPRDRCQSITSIREAVNTELDKRFKTDKHYPVEIPLNNRQAFEMRLPNVTIAMIKPPNFELIDQYILEDLSEAVDWHQTERNSLISLFEKRADQSRLLIGIAAPLMAVALALRMTKVTVEVRKALRERPTTCLPKKMTR